MGLAQDWLKVPSWLADTPCKARRLSIKGGTMLQILAGILLFYLAVVVGSGVYHVATVDQHS